MHGRRQLGAFAPQLPFHISYLVRVEFGRHRLGWPGNYRGHVNLKARFVQAYNLKRGVGLREAMRLLGIGFDGTQHRGIDDARNIAKIAKVLLRSRLV